MVYIFLLLIHPASFCFGGEMGMGMGMEDVFLLLKFVLKQNAGDSSS